MIFVEARKEGMENGPVRQYNCYRVITVLCALVMGSTTDGRIGGRNTTSEMWMSKVFYLL